jgi:hypothetical protein
MAGAIPIIVKPAEGEMIRSLNDVRLSRLLTVLDELGWDCAREVLVTLADDQEDDNNNKRSREIDDDDTCGTTASVGR